MPRESEPREFGALLREHRVAADLTQEALAQRSGVSPRTIQHLEASDVRPTRATLESLVRALELAPAALSRFEAAATRRPRGGVAGDGGAIRTPASNLLAPRTALIGREHEVAALSDLVGQGEARLVTLTGVGGVGKTRVALHVAYALRGRRGAFPGGVWLVELAPLADPARLPHAVAAALGVREAPGAPLLAALVAALRPQALLLVLDNCEHQLDACATLAQHLLDACPALRILATSREPLQIAGEQQLPIAPLAAPLEAGASPDGLAGYPAVELFVARAKAVAPDFRLTAENTAAVGQVCARLGGIPLALELAAARVRVLAPHQLAAPLDDALGLLAGGIRAAPTRQQTLRATLDWSHGLLTAPEEILFRRLAVLAGGCDLGAAEAIASDPAEDEPAPPAGSGQVLRRPEVLDLLARLVDKSLVVAQPGRNGAAGAWVARYGLLEPLRQYAWERLGAAGEAAHLGRRHAAHYLALAEQAEPGWYGPAQTAWLDRLEQEHDNLRAALRYWFDRGDAAHALRLGAALWWFWFNRGHWAEGHRWLTDLLALPGAGDFPAAYAQALVGAARLGGDAATGRALVAQAAALWRGLREQQGAADERARPALAFWAYAFVHAAALSGDPAAERGLGAQAAALWRSLGDPRQVAAALSELGLAARNRGEPAAARAWLEESLAVARRAGDGRGIGLALDRLGTVAHALGDEAAAASLYAESLAHFRELGDRGLVAWGLLNQGLLALERGEAAAARACARELLSIRRAQGTAGPPLLRQGQAPLTHALVLGAGLAAADAAPALSVRLAGAADAYGRTVGLPLPPLYRALLERWLGAARRALGPAAAAAWAEGQALPLDEALAAAEAASQPFPDAPAPPRDAPPASDPQGAAGGAGASPDPPSNLLAPRTALIGREHEVAALSDLVGQGEARLVTLTGVGGVGKTRVALHVAYALRGRRGAFPGGVWLVELAPLADPARLPHAVAAALGVREAPGAPLLAALVAALLPQALLLVLDNCEHQLDACATLAQHLLDACPALRILATSREPLHLAGEVQHRVPPLAVPEASEPAAVDELTLCPAVQLFVARAQAGAPAFRLVPENAAAVAHVCRRLDGIPLALELAAARVRLLAVEQILGRLDDSIQLLTSGSRAGPSRQQTLRATLDWGHDLLSEPERAAFRRLAAFPGSFDLEAAEAVGADDERPAPSAAAGSPAEDRRQPADGDDEEAGTPALSSVLGPDDVLDVLGRLVDKSLVVAESGSSGPARYRLLATLRQYALERLEASGESGAVRRRHAAHYLTLAERARAGLGGPERGVWLARLRPEDDNLRAALDWLAQGGEAESGLRLATAAALLWEARGDYTLARARLARLLALPGPVQTRTHAEALRIASDLAWKQGDCLAQQRYCEERLAICRALGERAGIAHALADLAAPLHLQGHYSQARALLEEALALYKVFGAGPELGSPLTKLANVARDQGDYPAARGLYDEALERFRAAGDRLNAGRVLSGLGWLALYQGDLPAARAWQEESLALRREVGDGWGTAVSLAALGRVAAAEGDAAAARSRYEESLALLRTTGNPGGLLLVLEGLAALAAPDQPQRALRLAGAADALRAAAGRPLPPPERPAYRRWLARTRDTAGERAAAAWEAGRTMTRDEAVAYALAAPAPRSPRSPPAGGVRGPAPGAAVSASPERRAVAPRDAESLRTGPPPGPLAPVEVLTPREQEVARLIAAGRRSDRQLAACLTVTPATAGVHVQHILEKLGLHSRWQIVDWATQQDRPEVLETPPARTG